MMKWRVLVFRSNKFPTIERYFNNQTTAMQFAKEAYASDSSCCVQVLKYNGVIWIYKKFWI